MNMTYCAYENTCQDLQQCLDKLEEKQDDEELGQYEAAAKKALIELCVKIANEYGEGDD